MPRATALLASAALASLVLVTACEPDSSGNAADPSLSRGPSPAAPASPATAPATATGGGHGASGVPDAAWIPSRDIPLDAAYHWPSPATGGKAAANPVFQVETVCGSKRSSDLDGITQGAHAARAQLGPGGGEWQASEVLVDWPGTTSGPIQTAATLFRGIGDELNACASTAPGARVKVAVDEGTRLAATLTVPQPGGAAVTLHEYLVDDSGTVAELAVWSTGHPKAAWSANDADVLKNLQAPLCSAFKDC